MLVHVFAGIAMDGLPAPGRSVGKNLKIWMYLFINLSLINYFEEDYKGIWDFLTDAVNVIYQPIDNLAIGNLQ